MTQKTLCIICGYIVYNNNSNCSFEKHTFILYNNNSNCNNNSNHNNNNKNDIYIYIRIMGSLDFSNFWSAEYTHTYTVDS